MSRIVRCSLIQASNAAAPDASLATTKKVMVDKHVAYLEQAAKAGSQIACLQEIFYGPYFCAEQTTRWYDFTEPIPDPLQRQPGFAVNREVLAQLVLGQPARPRAFAIEPFRQHLVQRDEHSLPLVRLERLQRRVRRESGAMEDLIGTRFENLARYGFTFVPVYIDGPPKQG